MKPLRIGILSTAGIGQKNWQAIYHSGNCVVAAVASRALEKSQTFIAGGQREFPFTEPPRALGSYAELIAAPDVDAVYVPLPTGLRPEWVRRAAAAGKHVLCEKPCATSAAELAELLAGCRNHAVQFLDGVMFMHNPRLAQIRAVLDDGRSVGRLRRLASAFTFHPGEEFFRANIRTDGALEPAGCLGDLGWYSLRFALWVMHWQLPQSVTGKILAESPATAGRAPTPTEFSGELFFAGGVSASFYCSFLTGRQQWFHVSGQDGWLRLPDFVRPLNSYEPAFEVNEQIITVPGAEKCPAGVDPMLAGHATAQDTRMWRNFASQIASGQLNDDWPMWALKTQQVMDACHEAAKRGAPVKLESKL